MTELKQMIYDIICAYYYLGERVYWRSIRTIFRGPVENAPVALRFKEFYFYGLRKEISDEVIHILLMQMIEDKLIIKVLNPKYNGYYYLPIDIEIALKRTQKIRITNNQLFEEFR